MRYKLLACALAAAVCPAWAQEVGTVHRGDLHWHILAHGTVQALQVAEIRSPEDGRIEKTPALENTWVHPETTLGLLDSKEFALMLDTTHTTPEEVLRERWKTTFQPIPFHCQSDCYVLSISVKPKAWVHTGDVLFKTASLLGMEGTFPAQASWDPGLERNLYVWTKSNPKRRFQVVIEKLSNGKVSAEVPFGADLPPGTEWEGVLDILLRTNVLEVPSSALIYHDRATYIPVRVSVGTSSEHETEIRSDLYEGEKFLNLHLDPSILPTNRVAPEPQ